MKSTASSRIKIFALRMLFTLVCLLLVLILFELYLRSEATYIVRNNLAGSSVIIDMNPEFLIMNTARGRRLVPNTDVTIKNHFLSHLDVRIQTNSLGFRDDPLPLEKGNNEVRILVLGDSVTVNDYLPVEESFVEQLEKLLTKELPDKKVQVINAGVGNIGIKEEVDILYESVEAVKPDIVLLAFYLNDSRPPWGFSGEIGDRGWLRRHSLIAETVYRKILEARWADRGGEKEIRFGWIEALKKLNWITNREDFINLAHQAKYDWGAAWQADSWRTVESELGRLAYAADRYSFKSAVAVFPVTFQVKSEFIEDAPQKKIQEIASSLSMPSLDLLPMLREHKHEELFYDQCHLTALGNNLVAEALRPFVTKIYLELSSI